MRKIIFKELEHHDLTKEAEGLKFLLLNPCGQVKKFYENPIINASSTANDDSDWASTV